MAVAKENLYLWYICMVAAACMILYGYDASTFNAVQGSKHWQEYFHHPDPNVIGSVNTAYTVGGIVAGFFISAPISNYLGRRWAIIIGCIVVIISTFISTFTPRNIGGFIGGRALVGIGQGIALPAGPVYIGELAPASNRGKIMSFWQMFYSVGSFLAYWINYACTQNSHKLGNWDWKIVMLFQLLAPVLIAIAIFFCPETPRWFIQKDRTEDAIKSLMTVRSSAEEVEVEIHEIRKAIAFENENYKGSYRPLWKDKTVRYRLILALLMNIGQQLTGQGSLNNYSTIIYQKVFTDNKTIQLINALNGTFGIIFTLNATWTVDRFGRKFLLITGAVGMAICMTIVAAVVTETPELEGGLKSRPVGISTVFLMFLFAFFYKPSWGATVWIWTGEVFSMNVRAQAVGMSAQAQNVANAVLQQVFPLFLDKKGFYAMYMFGAINVVLALFIIFLVPETKGLALENMDSLFGGENHTEQGAGMVEEKETAVKVIEYTSGDNRRQSERQQSV